MQLLCKSVLNDMLFTVQVNFIIFSRWRQAHARCCSWSYLSLVRLQLNTCEDLSEALDLLVEVEWLQQTVQLRAIHHDA